MTTEPKFVITGRGQDPAGHVGHTESEWSALFAAVARADAKAVEAAIGAAPKPAVLDVAAIYRHRRGGGRKS